MKFLLFVSMLLALNSLICCDLPIDDYLKVRDSRNFTGKVVLVTGSSAGIGAGIAKLFSILGANVVVTGRNVSRIQSVGKEVQELSPKKLKPLEIAADLLKPTELNRLAKQTIETFGRLDVLVNNAGIYPADNITDTFLLSEWEDIFDTNLKASVRLVQQLLPELRKTNGTVIDISSVAGLQPTAPQLAYSTSKAAVHMMTRDLALELGPIGIRVNSINPGAIAVERILSNPDFKAALEVIVKKTPLRRAGYPLDIAKGVVFLASSDADFISGANLVIDGGIQFNYPAYFD